MRAVVDLQLAADALPPAARVAALVLAALVACGLAVHAQRLARRAARAPWLAMGGLVLLAAAALMTDERGAALAALAYGAFAVFVEAARPAAAPAAARGGA